MAWAVFFLGGLVILVGFLSGDLRASFLARQTPQGLQSRLELISGFEGLQLRAGLGTPYELSFEVGWAVLVRKGPIPVRFEIDGLKGELKVRKGQRIKRGQVIAVFDVELLQKLERELPALEPQLAQEALAKIEELLIRAAVDGIIQRIRIEAVEGETIRIILEILDAKPLIYRK